MKASTSGYIKREVTDHVSIPRPPWLRFAAGTKQPIAAGVIFLDRMASSPRPSGLAVRSRESAGSLRDGNRGVETIE